MSSGNWGIVNRNTIGSPISDLRSGPFVPPLGKGSLNLTVKDGSEKVSYGNEMDFAGDLVKDLTDVGFHVYTTGENNAKGAENMPGITFEINPDAKGATYSSLVFMPANSTANQWSGYIDATTTGKWGLTSGKFDNASCNINGPRCTWAEVMGVLGANAKIMTAAVAKGRDAEWQGAVDGLRINDTVFDFEETGVFERAAE